MTKRKQPKQPESRRLKYNGGDTLPNITGIPARDIEHKELIEVSERWNMPIDAFIEMLCTKERGRQTRDGRPLYSLADPYICTQCKTEFVVWDDLHAHALTHIEKEGQ